MKNSALGKLRNGDATRWTNIAEAELRSAEKMQQLAMLLGDLLPTDEGSFVVFGSMARREFTVDSDLDWTILIDGRADSLHLQLVHQLRNKLDEAKFKVPGPTEVFGGLVFSHDLVHAIGGDEDTNKNMTRRLLLLLESAAVDAPGSHEVRSRIVNAVLSRYVQEDASFIGSNTRADRIPRFLLNDVVRFWRTMAVDYANKYRARAGDKWALRNIKLRMSRKLLFVSGFFMCVSWALRDQVGDDDSFVTQNLVDHLKDWTQKTPLESLATVVAQYAPSLASDIFDNYDAFLALLNNDEKRKGLEKLSPDEAYEDAAFLEARNVATNFDVALTKLMFDSDDSVTRLVKKYGVF
nr:DUF294 nucleotidyltransferase-like domain-containing protein [uncultured Devosia sp.]